MMRRLRYLLYKYGLIVISIITVCLSADAQQKTIKGVVLEEDGKGGYRPLIGAPVVWLHNKQGTATDTSGVFELTFPISYIHDKHSKLIVSYIGYIPDTIDVGMGNNVRIILAAAGGKELQEVEITEKLNSTFVNMLDARYTQIITEKELYKAACCNLSESFETNPSVDVQFTDAVSGAKQIQMLGLGGIYTQQTYENMPGNRGLGSSFGLGFTPGAWIESIQVTKGPGSVVNGYESIAGQINVELKKPYSNPKTSDNAFANLYINNMGRYELNLHATQKVNASWSHMTQVHGNTQLNMIDGNKDGFLDIPLGNQLQALHRWRYENKGWVIQMGARGLRDDRVGGEINFNAKTDKLKTNYYGIVLYTERVEGFMKAGYVFPEKKYKSIGWQSSLTHHVGDQYYGQVIYLSRQQTWYSNFIYQSIIQNTQHKFRSGVSYVVDAYDESIPTSAWKRNERIPGLFYEHTWTPEPRFTSILGLRADYHNIFGFFMTPRIHIKYDLGSFTILRMSAGRGQRTANILGENTVVFASSRRLIRSEELVGLGYNEVAWNFGGSIQHEFLWFGKTGTFLGDAYYTRFQKQVVADFDYNTQEIHFYPLKGRSDALSVQTEIEYQVTRSIDIRIAYRYYDVKTSYLSGLLLKPMVSAHRAFANVGYASKTGWKLDYTLNWNGPKRIPQTDQNPEQYKRRSFSPHFFVMHAQVSKRFSNFKTYWVDAYMGSENLANFTQKDLIISPENPFGSYFDASMVWGPVIGRMMYLGVRFGWKSKSGDETQDKM